MDLQPYEGYEYIPGRAPHIGYDIPPPVPRDQLEAPFNLWSVVGPCWNIEPTERPTAEQCFIPLISLVRK
jgi:hypothetical protein